MSVKTGQDQSADAVRQQLLLTRYQQSKAHLTARLNEHRQLIKQLTARGITVCDIQSRLASWPLAKPYQRELTQRGHLPAASQIASLQLLEQVGGIYSTNNTLPPLSDTFWRGVAQCYLRQQGLTNVDNPQQLEKSAATLKQAWLADVKIQAMTWQQLGQHNPAWMPVTTEADQAFSEHETEEWPALLLQAIDSYARSNPPLSSIFHPIEPLTMRTDQWVVVESALSHHNPLLLAAHPHSKLLQAVIQQVQRHYRSLEQLETTLCKQGKSLQDRENRIKVVERLALPPRLAVALVDYLVEGFSIGADATRELSGIGALQRGVEWYNANQLLPSKLLKTVQSASPLERVNHWIHYHDFQPFSVPLNSEQTAQRWYQQSKVLWAKQAKFNGEQPSLTLLDLTVDQPIKSILSKIDFMGNSQSSNVLISVLDKISEFLIKQKSTMLPVPSYELAITLLKRIIKAVQMQRKMSSYIALTCLQKVNTIARATLGMKLTKELSNKLLQYQLEQFNTCTRSINRELLKGALSNEIETIVHGEVVLRPASTGSRIMCLVNRPQKLDVAAGINDVTLPHGNFLIHEMATHKGVLFNLGDGNHEVIGVLNKPNQFLLSEGYQYFTGGNQRDCFILSLSAEALQRQIDRAMVQQQFSDSFSPPYRLEGDEGVNQLIIQSEFPQPSTGEPSEPPYIGYYVDLKLGRVWLRQYNPEDPEQPKDQALLLMTLRNINQLEIRSM